MAELNAKTLAAIERAKLRVAELRKQQEQKLAVQKSQIAQAMHTMVIPSLHTKGWKMDDSVDWNGEQQQAINAGLAGKSFCLIGAAGTGKTTTLKGIIYSLLKNELVPPIQGMKETKWLKGGTPGIVLCSFTNMAVRQIAKHFSGDITCITIHKLLEFAPVKYTVLGADGEEKTTMRFEPSRHAGNPLPRELKTIVVDEASMVDTDLFDLLLAALPNPAAVQFIFLGDLNQLPPVYGGPILGRKLLELPIIELTQVYRQALLSPIIRYALRMKDGLSTPIISGQPITEDCGEHGKVTVHPWSKVVSWEDGLLKMTGFLKAAIKEGFLDVNQDMVLCPYNVNFGVIELNRAVADYLGRQRDATVYEVVAGFETHYYAVGDKVLAQKQESFIVRIAKNPKYGGKQPINPELYDIDRNGGARKKKDLSLGEEFALTHTDSADDIDAFLESLVTTEVEDRKTACSHRIYLVPKDKYMEQRAVDVTEGLSLAESHDKMAGHTAWIIEGAAEVNEMLFGYCITVHKSQGSEWRRVFLITHNSHGKMCSRELMYTAMTRARTELYMIVEPDRGVRPGTLTSAAKKPRLKGNTLAEKLLSLKERFDKEAAEKQSANVAAARKQVTEEADIVEGEEA